MLRSGPKAAADLVPARAIIDIGSNTVRLVIYGGPPRAPTVLHNEKVTAKLGKGLAETGRLSASGMKAALAALMRFKLLVALQKVPKVEIVATAAVRDAEDGAAFLDAVRRVGFKPRLLSGEEEAKYSGLGVIGAFTAADGVVADLGGGSLELIDVGPEGCRHGVSLPLGTLRLAAQRANGDAGFRRFVAKSINKAGWQIERGATLFLVGGSLRAFARYAMDRLGWPFDDPHGFEIDSANAARLAAELSSSREGPLAPLSGISSSRLAVLPDTAALLEALIARLAPGRLVFSSWGLREGLAQATLSPAARAGDPLLAAVQAFTGHYGVDPVAAGRIAAWTAAPFAGGDETHHGRLREAAAAFALAAARVEPNLRCDESVGWVLRKRLVGASPAERLALAAAMLGNAGRTDFPANWRDLAPVEMLRAGRAWGLAIRLCRRLTGGASGALDGTRLALDDGGLVLSVSPALAALVTEGVQRDLRALGDRLGHSVRISAE